MCKCSHHEPLPASKYPNVYVDVYNLPTEPLKLKVGQNVVFIRPAIAGGERFRQLYFPHAFFIEDDVPPRSEFEGQPRGYHVLRFAQTKTAGEGKLSLWMAAARPGSVAGRPKLIPFVIAD